MLFGKDGFHVSIEIFQAARTLVLEILTVLVLAVVVNGIIDIVDSQKLNRNQTITFGSRKKGVALFVALLIQGAFLVYVLAMEAVTKTQVAFNTEPVTASSTGFEYDFLPKQLGMFNNTDRRIVYGTLHDVMFAASMACPQEVEVTRIQNGHRLRIRRNRPVFVAGELRDGNDLINGNLATTDMFRCNAVQDHISAEIISRVDFGDRETSWSGPSLSVCDNGTVERFGRVLMFKDARFEVRASLIREFGSRQSSFATNATASCLVYLQNASVSTVSNLEAVLKGFHSESDTRFHDMRCVTDFTIAEPVISGRYFLLAMWNNKEHSVSQDPASHGSFVVKQNAGLIVIRNPSRNISKELMYASSTNIAESSIDGLYEADVSSAVMANSAVRVLAGDLNFLTDIGKRFDVISSEKIIAASNLVMEGILLGCLTLSLLIVALARRCIASKITPMSRSEFSIELSKVGDGAKVPERRGREVVVPLSMMDLQQCTLEDDMPQDD